MPWIVSVDDHVIEPGSLWTSRLPERYREHGPRVVRLPAGELTLSGARYVERPGNDGPFVDYWTAMVRYRGIVLPETRPKTVDAYVTAYMHAPVPSPVHAYTFNAALPRVIRGIASSARALYECAERQFRTRVR